MQKRYHLLLCVYFAQMRLYNETSCSTSASIVYSKLCYLADGKNELIISKDRLLIATGLARTQCENALDMLTQTGMITKETKTYHGKNKFKVSLLYPHKKSSIYNFKRLKIISKFTGDYISAIILSYIAYTINSQRAILIEEKWYSHIDLKHVCDLLCISERTYKRIIADLKKNKIISSRKVSLNKKIYSYNTIEDSFYERISQEIPSKEETKAGFGTQLKEETKAGFGTQLKEETKAGFGTDASAKTRSSTIYIDKILKINNTRYRKKKREQQKKDCVINFKINSQDKYLEGAITNTFNRVGWPEHIEETRAKLAYAIQLSGKKIGLSHAINRILKIYRDGKFDSPHGFYKYDPLGRKLEADLQSRELEDLDRIMIGATDIAVYDQAIKDALIDSLKGLARSKNTGVLWRNKG